MKTEHTKGEWYAKDGQIYPTETGKTLAVIPYFNKEDKEQAANQKLIAAAPDLFDALSMAYAFMITDPQHQGRQILETIKSALIKGTEQ